MEAKGKRLALSQSVLRAKLVVLHYIAAALARLNGCAWFMIIKSVLGRIRNLCMLVLRLCCVMVASRHVVDTGQVHDLVKIVWSTVYSATQQESRFFFLELHAD